MGVPFLDLPLQYRSIKKEIDEAVINIFETGHFVLGPEVEAFEKNFAAYSQAQFAVGASSGTDAPHMILRAAGIGAGDEVITQANTFIATLEAIVLAGATPVLIDMHEDTYNMDPELIEAAVTEKTKAIFAVHLYGQPCQMDEINAIAKKHNLMVFEDNAQSVGATYKGRMTGSLADAASTSFYPGKNLGAYGDAGAVTTDNEELATAIRMIGNHGSSVKYHHEMIGWNSRLDGVQAVVLDIKLKYIDKWNQQRRDAAAMYTAQLADVEGIKLPTTHPDADHIYHLYIIQMENEEKRDALMQFLGEREIGTGIHYPIPCHMQNGYKFMGYNEGDFPRTEAYAKRIVSLPMFPEITEEQITEVTSAIKEFLGA